MARTAAQNHSAKPPGRPSGEAAADIRNAILEAAEALFARQGYAATPLREIADRVGVNSAMIHYYFGSKHALLRAVIERALEPLAAAIAGMRAAGRAPADRIVGLLIGTLGKRPNQPLLVAREVLLPGGEMREEFIADLAPRLGGALPELLGREQAAGRLRRDLDPRIAALILLSLCIFPFIVRETARPVFDLRYDETDLASLERHITRLLQEGFYP